MKKITILLILSLLLCSITAYGYWSDKLQVKTQIPILYPIEITQSKGGVKKLPSNPITSETTEEPKAEEPKVDESEELSDEYYVGENASPTKEQPTAPTMQTTDIAKEAENEDPYE